MKDTLLLHVTVARTLSKDTYFNECVCTLHFRDPLFKGHQIALGCIRHMVRARPQKHPEARVGASDCV